MAETAASAPSWTQSLAVYRDRRLIIILIQGFASGLPFLLSSVTLSAWLSEAGIAKTLIGFMAWASSIYALKFLWSPIVDRVPVPVLSRRFGQRRAWMLVAQAMCMATMVGLGLTDPASNLALTAVWVVALAFSSATQDIVIDAYRIEFLTPAQYGAGAAMTSLGYRVGILAAGGGALIVADAATWTIAYIAMAGLMIVAMITTLLCEEPKHPPQRERMSYVQWVQTSVVAPFTEFLQRPDAYAILMFIALYKYGDALLGIMANPFYLEIGFTKTQIGLISKTYGVGMTMLGGFAGGAIVARFGIMRALLIGGIAMATCHLFYVALAFAGPSIPIFVMTLAFDNFANGIGGAAFIAYLSSLCNLSYTATQYALMSSFFAFSRTVLSSGGGWLADRMNWANYFLLTTVAAVPGILLAIYLMRRSQAEAVGK